LIIACDFIGFPRFSTPVANTGANPQLVVVVSSQR